jgi:16S rRNA (guanine527-N7)-methyltransferase
MDRRLVVTTLEHVGLAGPDDLIDQLLELTGELAFWGPKLGLSTLEDENVVLVRHVLDSLLLAKGTPAPPNLLDIGTGAGLPAVPLAMAWPRCHVVAMDGKRKSNWLVTKLASQFALENLKHVCRRSDSAEARGALAGQFDMVTSRGLAQVDKALALSRPYLTPQGVISVLGGPDLDERAGHPSEELRIVEIPGTEWRRRILLRRGSVTDL